MHKLDKKYLPDDIGGGVFKVNVSYDATNSMWVCDKTYDEITAAEEAKTPIVGTFTNKSGLTFTCVGCDAVVANCRLAAFNLITSSAPVIYEIKVLVDNATVEVYELALTATATQIT